MTFFSGRPSRRFPAPRQHRSSVHVPRPRPGDEGRIYSRGGGHGPRQPCSQHYRLSGGQSAGCQWQQPGLQQKQLLCGSVWGCCRGHTRSGGGQRWTWRWWEDQKTCLQSTKVPMYQHWFNHICLFVYFQVTATDADEDLNGKVLYFLSQETHGAFTVDENTGRITTASPLDREKLASYSFQVFAVDLSPAAPRNTSAQVKEVRCWGGVQLSIFLFIT